MMDRLIFVFFLLASTLGADLTGLLEQLSQGERERGEYDMIGHHLQYLVAIFLVFVVSCP